MKIKLVTQEQLDEKLKNVEMTEEELQEIYVNVDTKISTSEIKTKSEIDTKINGAKTELGNKIENTKTDLGSQITELDSKVDVQYLDTNTSLDKLESDVSGLDTRVTQNTSKINSAKTELDTKIDSAKTELGTQITELDSKLDVQYLDTNTSIDAIESDVAKKQDKLTAGDNIDITRDTISATDTITTINGKTGAISKADITALGIPSQDTVYKKPSSEPISYIQGLQAELDSKVESYGANPVLNIAVINAGGSTSGIPNNTLILEME